MPETICAAMRVVSPYGLTVGSESDPRDVDRQLREQRRADADQNVGAKAGGFSGQFALEADRAAEQRGEQKLAEHAESQRLGKRGNRLGKSPVASA